MYQYINVTIYLLQQVQPLQQVQQTAPTFPQKSNSFFLLLRNELGTDCRSAETPATAHRKHQGSTSESRAVFRGEGWLWHFAIRNGFCQRNF